MCEVEVNIHPSECHTGCHFACWAHKIWILVHKNAVHFSWQLPTFKTERDSPRGRPEVVKIIYCYQFFFILRLSCYHRIIYYDKLQIAYMFGVFLMPFLCHSLWVANGHPDDESCSGGTSEKTHAPNPSPGYTVLGRSVKTCLLGDQDRSGGLWLTRG